MLFGLLKSLDEKVKEEKDTLLSKLKSSDIRTLVKEMGNHEPISDNIVKKQKRDKSFSSEDFRNWFAYKISNTLNDPTLKSQLIQLLDDQDFKESKRHILRCLSSLCVNTTDYELFNFLMGELQKCNDEGIISTVLIRLGHLRKPSTVNIDYLKNLLLNGTYQNKISALDALANAEHSELEDILLQEFPSSDAHTKGMICATLRSTGTTKCIDILKSEHKRTRNSTLKYYIESTIEEINKRKKDSVGNN